jgi:membrane associated rhomboid family serine protease
VLGASGAIFGLMGAYFVIARRLGGNNTQIIIVIALNLVAGFVIPNVSWQAHLGGLVVGCLVAATYLATRRSADRTRQVLLVAGLAAALIAVLVLRVLTL